MAEKQLGTAPANDPDIATKKYVDDEIALVNGASGIATSIVDAKGDLIVATGNDAVDRLPVSGNNGYVLTEDSGEATGLKWAAASATGGGYTLEPARVATTAAETYTVSSGNVTQISGTTVDSVSVAVGDHIVIKDAPAASGAGSANSTQPGNGIYEVTNNTTNLSLSRVTEMSGSVVPAGLSVYVQAGANAGNAFVVTTPSSNAAFTYGSDSIAWTKSSSDTATATLTNKTLTTPTIASFTNATHNHEDAAGGGQLTVDAINASGTPDGTTYLRGDGTWSTPAGGGSSGETVTTSSATSLALATTSTMYVFTGSSATVWTLPAVSGNTGARFILSNRGSANITLQRAGSDNLYLDATATSIVIGPGGSRSVVNDGTYWVATSPVALTDANFKLQDDSDTTKEAKFDLSGLTTGQSRTYTMPDVSATIPAKYIATIGNGSSTSIAVTHNLNTEDIVWSIRDASTDEFVDCDVTSTSTTQTTFTFETAPASNSLKVVIIG